MILQLLWKRTRVTYVSLKILSINRFTPLYFQQDYVDISYAVGRLSRQTSNPNREHWTALERVFRYLRGIIAYCLTYTGYLDVIEEYSDADWVTDSHSVKSTNGYVFMFNSAAVS